MSGFTEEGRRAAATPCPVSFTGRHEPDQVQARLGTFYCSRCGAVPKDSVWYRMDVRLMEQRHSAMRTAPEVVSEKRTVDCPGCGGTGYSSKTKKTCTICKGTGKITVDI